MNSNKKAAEWAARQDEGQEGAKGPGEVNPCWITFFGIIEELHAKLDKLDAAEKAAQEAAESLGGSSPCISAKPRCALRSSHYGHHGSSHSRNRERPISVRRR